MGATYQGYSNTSNIWNLSDEASVTSTNSLDVRISEATPTKITGVSPQAFNNILLKAEMYGSFNIPSNYQTGGDTWAGISGTVTGWTVYIARASAPTTWIEWESVTGFSVKSSDVTNFSSEKFIGVNAQIDALIYAGDDLFLPHSGSAEADGINGYAGNDVYKGYGDDNPGAKTTTYQGSDFFDGGAGTDTAVYQGKASEYRILENTNIWDRMSESSPQFTSGYRVVDSVTGRDGTDDLVGVERLRFTDKTVALDFEAGQNGYKAAMFVGAAFGADYLDDYFAPAVGLIDSGMSVGQLSQLVIDLGLMDTLAGKTNREFVDHVYENVVGVAPDALSEALYVNYLDRGVFTKASLLELAAGVPLLENQIDLVGLQANGLDYVPFL